MKKLFLTFALLVPTLSFANIYSCTGAGFVIDLTADPLELKISGNGINSLAKNIRITSTFDTVITANLSTPPATIKLIIKDSSFGNPGDQFVSSLQVSTPIGIKDFPGLVCIRGNE